ncbi:MAG: hypothetical protein AAF907_03120 [Planctomycetota bacterium]
MPDADAPPPIGPTPDVPETKEAQPAAPSALPSRFGVGLAALACFGLAVGTYAVRPDAELWWAGAMRVGVVMAALWLALPARGREAAWSSWDWKAVGVVTLCGLLSFRAPQIGVPLLAGWWFWRWLKAVPPTNLP